MTRTPQETSETSVSFSLQELMRIEQQRLHEQDRDRAQRAQRQAQAERERHEQLRAQEQAQLRTQQEHRRLEEARGREEAARIEAMRQAIVQRERNEALERARLIEVQQVRKHELEMAAIRHDAHKRKLLVGVIAVSAACVILAGSGMGAYVGMIKPQADARAADLTNRMMQREQENDELKHRLDAQLTRSDKLVDELQASETKRSMLVARLEAAERELAQRKGLPPASHTSVVSAPTAARCVGEAAKYDPMCGLGGVRTDP